jgi:hypothetical protein
MGNPSQILMSFLFILLSVLKAGIFSVHNDQPIFPFSFQHAITPLYPPGESHAVIQLINNSPFIPGSVEFKPDKSLREVQNYWPFELVIGSFLNLRQTSQDYLSFSIQIAPGLDSTRVIFPFHTFW